MTDREGTPASGNDRMLAALSKAGGTGLGEQGPCKGRPQAGESPASGNDRLLAVLVKEATNAEAPPRHAWYLMNASFGFITEAVGRRKQLLGVPRMFPLDDLQRLELEISMLNDETKAKLAAWARRVKQK